MAWLAFIFSALTCVPTVHDLGSQLFRQSLQIGHELLVPGIVPKLSATPGRIRASAPRLGEDTDAVLAEAGLTPGQIALLRERGIVQ